MRESDGVQRADVWDYSDRQSATQHESTCPTCGQAIEGGLLRGSLWHEMMGLALHVQQGEELRKMLERRERKASAEVRAHINRSSTYRVQKNLLVRCLDAGIPLLGQDGKPKGKTALEAELRRARQ